MGRVQRTRDLQGHPQQEIILHRLTVEAPFQCLSFEQFHRNEMPRVGLTDFVDLADIRMVQRGNYARFALELIQRTRTFQRS